MSLQKIPSPGKLLAALSLTLLLGSIQALAEDRFRLVPSVQVSQEYDTDVLRDDENEEDDFVTRISPMLRFALENGRGHAFADLGLTQRYYDELDDLDALDWYGSWDVDRRLTPRLSLVSDGNVTFLEATDGVTEGESVIAGERVDLRDRRFSGGLRYKLDARSNLTGLLGYSDADFSLDGKPGGAGRRDRDTRYAMLDYQRMLSPRDTVGLNLQAARTEYDAVRIDRSAASAQDDDYYALSGSWNRAWSPIWTTYVRAGLRSLTSEVQGSDDTSTSFVGGLALERTFDSGSASLAYNRETRPSSSFGSSLDHDTIDALLERKLTDRLSLRITGQLARLSSASESTFLRCDILQFAFIDGELRVVGCASGTVVSSSDEIDTRTFAAGARLNWRLGKHWSTFASYGFRDQDSRGKRQLNDFDSHRFMIGFLARRPMALR